jgi:protein SCO1/2
MTTPSVTACPHSWRPRSAGTRPADTRPANTVFPQTTAGPRSVRRRRCLLALGLAACASMPVLAHGNLGPVTPVRPVPPALSVRYRGRPTPLRELLLGKTSAVQLMFAGCSSICPMQGAMFAAAQLAMGADGYPALQFLSLSIDALGDDAAALASWLQRFSAQPGWRAAALETTDLAALQKLFGTTTETPAGHSTAVYFFDATASLVWRTNDLPGAREVAATLRRIHRAAAV